jgi:hypothetical protein
MSQVRRPSFLKYCSAGRRLVAVLCVLAFTVCGIAHSLSHFEGMSTAIEAQLGDASDNSVDDSKSTALAVNHCCGCGAIASPTVGAATVAELIEVDFAFPPTSLVRAHDPTFATPPPKS